MIPKVSIITLTHQGREKFLPKMIDSVKNQTLTDWELIVIDNGQYNDTEKIISELAKNDKRFVYIKNEIDPGISAARNLGLKTARGEFIAILDSDDWWSNKEKLANQVDYLKNNPNCVAVGTGVIVIDEQDTEINKYQNPAAPEKIKSSILKKNPLAHSSVLYYRQAALHVGGYDETLPFLEDYDLWLKMGIIWPLANLSEYMTKYRQHASSVTREKILAMMKMNIRLVMKYRKDYPNFWLAYLRRSVRYLVKKLLMGK